MAFRKKARFVLAHQPDLLIVQECEHPDRLHFDDELQKPTNCLWYGENKHKGMAILSYGNCRIKEEANHNPVFRTIVPVKVTLNRSSLLLFAIWAFNPTDKNAVYIEQVWKAIDHYENFLSNKKTILAGDFNSNAIWDRKHRISNHSNVVKRLSEKGIHSVYHSHFKQVQGHEIHPTFYFYRHKDKPYHLDYCFASADLIKKMDQVEVGAYEHWSTYSDHMPLIVTFR
jgi:exonuclease III